MPYQRDSGDWSSLQPDFVIVSKRDDGTLGASIVDPHGDHLADAKNKLVALARYAEHLGGDFVRIESITQVAGGQLQALDLRDPEVRKAATKLAGAEVRELYEAARWKLPCRRRRWVPRRVQLLRYLDRGRRLSQMTYL